MAKHGDVSQREAVKDTPTAETSTAKADVAPEPDDARKPDSPTDITKPWWMYILKKTLREFSSDQCPDLAASLTYYGVLSMFPALLALVSLLGVFGQAERTTAAILDLAQGIAPGSSMELIRQPVEELTKSTTAGLTFFIGLAVALWSASGYVGAFARAMNRIYEVDEGRGFIKLRGTMLAVTVVTVVMVAILASLLVVTGPIAEAVGNLIGLGKAFQSAWDLAKLPVVIVLAIMLIAILYYATPNVKQPKFRWMSIGSFIALVIFMLSSLGFGFYVANFSNYNKTYGAIAGVIVLLLWLWITNMSLLFGAELDAEMERGRQLQAGIEAEETLQLPPRDTKLSKKLQDREEEDIAYGRDLREQYSRDNETSQDGRDGRRDGGKE
ncbi:YihY/virulence factor BrkB family protein [Arthrobacter sp. M4]|uniref:YihY/virulence factor BrkB family protein n=1 Tax=Arthrobacter sp. M4 TaxID=218160 RepID=UPI001CDD7AC8|nr:YihY/virulence factor BrkB family protein [Arthrobacter sp. M4]MCA4134175.1 YihY/virulence factor BrkB family protein [Arthrobacter sp. M4]